MKFNFQTIFNDRRIKISINGVRLNLLARDVVNSIDDVTLANKIFSAMAQFDANRTAAMTKNKIEGKSLYMNLPKMFKITFDDLDMVVMELAY